MNTKIIALGLLGIASVLIAHDVIEFEDDKSWF